MWVYLICNIFKCYLGVNMGLSLIKFGVEIILDGLKLLVV